MLTMHWTLNEEGRLTATWTHNGTPYAPAALPAPKPAPARATPLLRTLLTAMQHLPMKGGAA